MTILVTGGAGYIGSHMVHELVDRGEEVVVLDDLSTGHRHAVPDGVELVVGDVGDTELVAGVLRRRGIAEIAHFAARIVVVDSMAQPLDYYMNNTVRSRALFEAAVDCGVQRVIFSSTAAVYGEAGTDLIPESADKRPITPYGRSKLATEWMLADIAAAHGFSYAMLRYFNVAGAEPKGRIGQSSARATHLIKVAAEAAAGKRPVVEVYGEDYPTPDGTCIRDYVHVTDLANAHLAVLDALRAGSAPLVYNCGYGRGFSVREVLDVVRKVSGVDFPVVPKPRRPGDPPCLVADSRRIQAELGWRPQFDDLEMIVRSALAWEAELARRAGSAGSGGMAAGGRLA
ncbi:UDP-glucose 4-epimerase GalE [Xanthobacter sp. KR7-65]|uniref:UDP-glucose 4-epimerase GalE n=1 Tax=Xanthobacter sp. KR7-65 TaxID=3156612 RepID=UPI0032B53F3F